MPWRNQLIYFWVTIEYKYHVFDSHSSVYTYSCRHCWFRRLSRRTFQHRGRPCRPWWCRSRRYRSGRSWTPSSPRRTWCRPKPLNTQGTKYNRGANILVCRLAPIFFLKGRIRFLFKGTDPDFSKADPDPGLNSDPVNFRQQLCHGREFWN